MKCSRLSVLILFVYVTRRRTANCVALAILIGSLRTNWLMIYCFFTFDDLLSVVISRTSLTYKNVKTKTRIEPKLKRQWKRKCQRITETRTKMILKTKNHCLLVDLGAVFWGTAAARCSAHKDRKRTKNIRRKCFKKLLFHSVTSDFLTLGASSLELWFLSYCQNWNCDSKVAVYTVLSCRFVVYDEHKYMSSVDPMSKFVYRESMSQKTLSRWSRRGSRDGPQEKYFRGWTVGGACH